jgi:hypothetical protein
MTQVQRKGVQKVVLENYISNLHLSGCIIEVEQLRGAIAEISGAAEFETAWLLRGCGDKMEQCVVQQHHL